MSTLVNRAKWRSHYRLAKLILIRTMSCVEGEGCLTLQEGEREFEVGGTTIVWFNYPLTCCWKLWIPRARTMRIFHCHLLRRPSTASSTSIVKGRSLVFRGPEERGSLSREEIVFPPRGRKFSCRRASSFLRERGVAREGGYCIVGCIAGCVGVCVVD